MLIAKFTNQIKNSDRELYDKLVQKYIVDTPVQMTMEPYSTLKLLYSQGDLIGEGKFGSVRQGIGHCGQVAIKTVKISSVHKSHYWRQDDSGQVIPKEVYFLQKVQYIPGVLKLRDFSITDNEYVIVTEKPAICCDLMCLDRLCESKARKYLQQVVETVAKCSLAGVLHLDIKSNNIILDLVADEVKLIDFGCSREFTHDKLRVSNGPKMWSPPERLEKKSFNGDKLQVWTIGVLLFEMITGELPFKTEEDICSGALEIPQYLTKSCQDLIKLCLNPDYRLRPTYDEILYHDWCNQE